MMQKIIDMNKEYSLREEYSLLKISGEYCIVKTDDENPLSKLYKINKVGCKIIDLLHEKILVSDIIQKIGAMYSDIDFSIIESDCIDFLTTLLDSNIIEVDKEMEGGED